MKPDEIKALVILRNIAGKESRPTDDGLKRRSGFLPDNTPTV